MGDFRITIIGAGNVGSALAACLATSGGFDVHVVDPSEQALDRLQELGLPVRLHHLGPHEPLANRLKQSDVTVAAVPERAIPAVARAAASAKTHFLDFSPPHAETRQALEPLAGERIVLNGCGVSPGLVENIASGLLARYAPVCDLTIRVGSVPRFPTNRLGYGQIWDIDGLIDEYTAPCEALRNGEHVLLAPLEGKEHVVLDGVTYEGFTTSRGLKDLAMFRAAGVGDVTFKTLRYPGHLDHMQFLLDDLGLRTRRDMLRSLLLNGLPIVEEDELVMFLTARSARGARKLEASSSYRFRPSATLGPFNAITSVAAGYAAGLLSLLRDGDLGGSGFVAHHAVSHAGVLENPYFSPLLVR
ncbi:MAG: saccharopine dehydrogenase NADP-binding domain-containing protein [Rhizobiaceae bacterium]|nr:saccharopine dehydrogenase NADP-binding domain-containing protein [Rhizobiaceae bacterium]